LIIRWINVLEDFLRVTTRWLIVSGLIFASLLLLPLARPQKSARQAGSVVLAAAPQISGFARASGPQPLVFPRDLGPHPEYQTEWWYYTGNLQTASGRHFGYQFTIFRRALLPQAQLSPRPSQWQTTQVFMGHFALTDSRLGQHHAFERFARGAAGVAGAQADPYLVWLDDWSVELVGGDPGRGVYRLRAAQDGIAIDLELKDLKGVVLHGDQGYSQKGPDPGNASYYYSQTRLETLGTVQVDGETFPVQGASWKDHEYGTSALSADQVGWDWFALQLDDGAELKVFYIRNSDGSIDTFSSGSFIDARGTLHRLGRDDFEILVSDTWTSPETGAVYPSRWTVRVPAYQIELQLTPTVADQELNVSYDYWEGAVRITGSCLGSAVTGWGYVEMTGYARSMAGEL
jgi:predicted secreted hydrolase